MKNITTYVGGDAHQKDRFVAMLIEDRLTSRPPVEIPIASFKLPAGNAKKHRQGETGEPLGGCRLVLVALYEAV